MALFDYQRLSYWAMNSFLPATPHHLEAIHLDFYSSWRSNMEFQSVTDTRICLRIPYSIYFMMIYIYISIVYILYYIYIILYILYYLYILYIYICTILYYIYIISYHIYISILYYCILYIYVQYIILYIVIYIYIIPATHPVLLLPNHGGNDLRHDDAADRTKDLRPKAVELAFGNQPWQSKIV